MKSIKKTAALLLLIIAACQFTGAAYALDNAYGASQINESETYKLAQMLTYAIEDEYLANARYTIDIEKFGDQKVFTRNAEAEKRHISLMLALLASHNIPVPEDKGKIYVAAPDSLLAAMKDGIDSEKSTFRMYDFFLKKQHLPDDVRITFALLKNAAQSHIKTFEKNVEMLQRML